MLTQWTTNKEFQLLEVGIISDLIARGALFVINHSGGKDSQAMMIRLLKVVPREQLLVVHASLGEIEWEGALELAQQQAADAGVPFIVARATKSFLDMVEHRFATRPDVPAFPSAAHRQCTSDLKRGPIEREVRRWIKAENARRNHVMPIDHVVTCMGLRAAESPARAKLEVFKRNTRNSVAGREWYEWAPIHTLSTAEVFETIANADQAPHWAYAAGNERLSCFFCIMDSRKDIANGAKHRPELFARYVELEERTGYTMHMSRKPLTQLVAEAKLIAEASAS
jgi:3'-phosphoadenosine 5'-phosphosulfate sulfotransferase (PAPS reductase)/FAD synthetase